MKKVLVILVIVLALGGVGFGGYKFYNLYKEYQTEVSLNASLSSQVANVQATLDSIGEMGIVYTVSSPKESGQEITEADLVELSVPVASYGDSTVSDKESLIGSHYRINIEPGTVITKDLLMPEDVTSNPKFPIELTFDSLPVTLEVGDYVDLRMILSSGEEYVILNHMEVKYISNTTLQFYVTEEENQLFYAALSDVGIYPNACKIYVLKYLEPGNDNSVPFYPVQSDVEKMLYFNPNITDPTRCINPTLRSHIDQQLMLLSTTDNSANASAFMSAFSTQLAGQLSMRADYATAKEQAKQNAELQATSTKTTEEVVTEEEDMEEIK